MRSVAIMQPTFLPWAGYFALLDQVDVFVLLDSVQFDRRSWQQRNRIKTAQGPLWLTVPVLSKGHRDQLINEVLIDKNRDFPRAHNRSIQSNYSKTPYYKKNAADLFAILDRGYEKLVDLNITLIEWLQNTLGINTVLKRSSDMGNTGAKAELLADMCKQLQADVYISPPGSKGYLDESDAFERQGIDVRYQDFSHPEYSQRFGSFLPYMSVIDLLFNVGSDSLSLIRKGCGSVNPEVVRGC